MLSCCIQCRVKPTVSSEELRWHFVPYLSMESTNQECQMLKGFTQKKACNQSAILLLTHNAAGYYGSAWRALVSVRVIVRESLYTSYTLCPVCYKKMASNSMAGPLGRKLFCRFLGANRYMLPLNSNLYTFIKYVMSEWYAFCLIRSRKQLWWTIGAQYTSGKFLFNILK